MPHVCGWSSLLPLSVMSCAPPRHVQLLQPTLDVGSDGLPPTLRITCGLAPTVFAAAAVT
jgi:hypothetical protein